MNLLYFGDMHTDKVPSSRVDNFQETQRVKIKEIRALAKKHNVKALLQGGDFLNKGRLSDQEMSRIYDLWERVTLNTVEDNVLDVNKFIEAIKNNNIQPMIGIVGNHDLIGGDIGSLEKTSINALAKSGFMTFATKENPIILKDEKGFTVAITGSHYNHEIDEEDKSAYIVDKKLGDYHIHLVHGMLMDKSYGKKFKHTTISEIAYKTKADLTINGHDHIGYDLTEIDGKLFVNPGSPFRLSSDKKEVNRKPKVLIINIEETGLKVETHYLKSAKKGDEVLTREHIIASKLKKDKIAEIESAVTKANLGKGVDITDIIKEISINDKLDEDISNEAIALIVDKMKELDTPFNPPGEFIIENITIENFLSHKYTSLDFTEGLNILYGKSRSGKSSVLRAIREVFECYINNPRDFIFYNEPYFKITLTLSNGYVISRIVEKKKTGKNGYEIFDPNTGVFSTYNTKAVSLVQEIVGLKKIKLSEKNQIGLNFLNQGDGWFFIGKGISAPDKAKLTGVVYGTHYADAVLKDINSKTKKIVSEINFCGKEIDKLETEKAKFDYLEEYEELILKAEKEMEILLQKEEELKNINEIKEELDKIKKEEEELEYIISEIEKNEEDYNDLFEQLEGKVETFNKIKDLSKELKDIITAGKEASYIVSKLKDISEAESYLEKIIEIDNINKEKELILKNYKEIDTEIKALNNEINNINVVINKLNDIEKAEKLLEEIDIMDKNTKEIMLIKNDISEIEADINKNENIINENNSIIERGLAEYKEELLKAGKCPVCNSNIDNIIVEAVIEEFSR